MQEVKGLARDGAPWPSGARSSQPRQTVRTSCRGNFPSRDFLIGQVFSIRLGGGKGIEFYGYPVAQSGGFATDYSAVGPPGALAALGGEGEADVLAFFDGLLAEGAHAVDRHVADGEAQAGLAVGQQRMIEAMRLGDHLLLFAREHAEVGAGSFCIVATQGEHGY